MAAKAYHCSIRCYFPGIDNKTRHHQVMPLRDVAKWIEAYQFTHPNCESVSVKVWLRDEEARETEAL